MSAKIPYITDYKDKTKHGACRFILAEGDTFELKINGQIVSLPWNTTIAMGENAKLVISINFAPADSWNKVGKLISVMTDGKEEFVAIQTGPGANEYRNLTPEEYEAANSP